MFVGFSWTGILVKLMETMKFYDLCQINTINSLCLLCKELMETFVSSESGNAGGGVAFPVHQSQRFFGSWLLQQEACDPAEASPCCKMQQSLLWIHVCRGDRRRDIREKSIDQTKTRGWYTPGCQCVVKAQFFTRKDWLRLRNGLGKPSLETVRLQIAEILF